MRSSRFVRPATPDGPVVLTSRDYRVFAALRDYGLLYTRHLQALCFPDSTLRRAQHRLRQLWAHRVLNRTFRPVVFDGTTPFQIDMAYCLGPKSEGLVVEGDVLGSPKEPSPSRFDHEIAVADCLTAITAACRGRTDVALTTVRPARPLLRRLKTGAPLGGERPYLVPDGAVTLAYPSGVSHTVYIEIVRADVKSGNEHLARKMRDYVSLNHEGRLAELFGHGNLRAVLFLTTSDERAEHFRQLAAVLPHGRRLFWFGSYQEVGEDGRALTTLTPATVLTPRWRGADDEVHSFLSP